MFIPDWDETKDSIVDVLRQRGLSEQERQQRLRPLVSALKTNGVNAWHSWRDTQFNLLFHASMEDSLVAVKMLLEKVKRKN